MYGNVNRSIYRRMDAKQCSAKDYLAYSSGKLITLTDINFRHLYLRGLKCVGRFLFQLSTMIYCKNPYIRNINGFV